MPEPPVPQLRPIVIRGARTHNLRNVDVTIATRRLTVVTGVSGSGKSSLAFDTLYAEGQRRYVESLSAYARQFLERMERPDVDASRAFRPPSRSDRRTACATPARPWGRPPKSTTICDCSLRGSAGRSAGRAAATSCARPQRRWPTARGAPDRVATPDWLRDAARSRLVGLGDAVEDDADDDGRNGHGAGKSPWRGAGGRSARDTLDSLRRKGFARLLIDGRAVHLDEMDPRASPIGRRSRSSSTAMRSRATCGRG